MNKAADYTLITHPFEPVYGPDSATLILGTMASVKSREAQFYYGNPQNRFWRVIASVTGSETPETVEEKKAMLLANHLAIWDVLQSCEIIGSDDHSIRQPVANDLSAILRRCPIKKIVTNGKTADRLYRSLCMEQTRIESVCLPSTSPANAAWRLDRLAEAWQAILP